MKITFGMIVFNGNYVLKEAIESIYPYAHQILVAEGPVQYWQDEGYQTSNDGTNDVLSQLYDPDHKITIVHSQYKEKDDQCNMYMSLMKPDTDYVWNLDCDEVFKPKDTEKVLELLEKEKYTSVGFKSQTFYGGFERYLTGFEENAEFIRIRKVYPGSYWSTHRPPTVAHVVKAEDRLPEKHLNYNVLADEHDVRMYHYSYVFPHQVFNKIKYYKEFLNSANTIDNYFSHVYLPWVIGSDHMKNMIEDKYHGVHEWIPQARGECRTAEFTGEHPEVINTEELNEKLKKQLTKYI